MFSGNGYRWGMAQLDPRAELRAAFAAADNEGTAALNLVLVAGAVVIVSAVALTAATGLAGVLATLTVWLLTLAAIALWLAPHLTAVHASAADTQRRQQNEREAERRRAIALLLEETTGSPEQQRRAAEILAEDD